MSKYEDENSVGKQDLSHLRMCQRQFDFINSNSNINDYTSVLDIGAATGENLSLYKKHGKRVIGIEPSANNKKYAFDRFLIKMYDMTFDEYCDKIGIKQKFDLVFLSHTLEHIVDVRGFIRKVTLISSKYIFIEIPFLENMGNGLEPFGLFTDEHVNYFTISGLSYLMNTEGCQLIKANIEFNIGGVVPGYPTLVTLWKKGEASAAKHKMSYVPSACSLVRDYINRSLEEFTRINQIIDSINDNEKLAIWGTGTHTSRLLGMTKLRTKNIVRFYDSDKKKQGMTMLGKSIQTFKKSDIENGEIETILISSFGSESVIRESIKEESIITPYRVISLYSSDI